MKKRIFQTLAFIFAFPVILLMISQLTGIGKKEEGYKTYPAYSPLKEGQELIAKNKIRCVAKDVECLAFIETGRGKTFFAYDIDHNNYYFYENIDYKIVPEKLVETFQIVPQFTWLDNYGSYVVYGGPFVCLIIITALSIFGKVDLFSTLFSW